MATHKIRIMGMARHGVWMTLVLAIVFLSVRAGLTQDEAPSALRLSQTLRQAIELHQRQEYEQAAQYFAVVQPRQQLLTPSERADFSKIGMANSIALKGRQDGGAQIQLAESALKENRLQDAAGLLKSLTANQYLTQADRQALADLNRRLTTQSSAAAAQGKADAKSLLAQGRAALQKGDFATAESLANRADKASSLIPQWMRPWDDSGDKLRRDIQAARTKLAAPPPGDMPKNPEPVASSSSKFMNIWPFGSSSSAKKDELSPAGNLAMARHMVKDASIFIQANDLDKAHLVASEAKKLNAAFTPGETTPDMLLQEIQKRKGIVPTAGNLPAPVNPKDAKAAAKPEPIPANADARTLLKLGRSLLEKKKYEEAEKLCAMSQAANGRWGLFEDTPDKLRKDIQKVRQSADRDESVKLLTEARKLFTQNVLEEAEKKAFRAKQLHGPYGVFDFGDRPDKLLEEIHRAQAARGPVKDAPRELPIAKDNPNRGGSGIPFETPRMQSENKNRAIVMLGQAREMERRGMLVEARQKAIEARGLKAVFGPEEESPDSLLMSLSAACDRQIVAMLQQAVRVAGDPSDANRFVKAQEQIHAANRLAQVFELDSIKIQQTQRHVQQLASGNPAPGGNDLLIKSPIVRVGDVSTGDPKKDQLRTIGIEKLQQAQLELTHGKTKQARKMAEDVFLADCGLQLEAQALLRSISAEENNQQFLEAKRSFDGGLEAFLHKDYRKAAAIFEMIDVRMLPESYQVRLRDIMATPAMQGGAIAQVGERTNLKSERIIEIHPGELRPEPKGVNDVGDPMDPVALRKAKEAVQFQALRQHGQEALRTAHDLYKNNQKQEALDTLKNYIGQVELSGLDPKESVNLKRLPEARIQQYRTMIAEETIKGLEKSGSGKWDEAKYARDNRKKYEEISEKMKLVTELFKQNKLNEAEAEVRKVREIDPENLSAVEWLHTIVNKRNQKEYDDEIHRDEKNHIKLLGGGMGPIPDMDKGVMFPTDRKPREKNGGEILHQLTNPKERAIEYRLRQPISLNFKDTPLKDAIRTLTLLSGVQVQPDMAALDDQKINLDAPLSVTVDDIDMKSALNLMLNRLRLTYTIENQCLMITTHEKTKGRLRRVTYPVGDLVVAVPDHPLPDVFSIEEAIRRSMAPPNLGGYSSIMAPQYPMSPGMPVSSHGNGLGEAFGSQNQPRKGVGGVQASPNRTKEAMAEVLKELIQNTIAKNSWEAMGGNGSIQYFPMGMAMVINQPQEVQEEVALLLKTLRQLQDLQVSVELRAVLVSETFFERIGVDFDMNIRTPTSRNEPNLVNGTFVPAPFINRTGSGLGGLISGLTSAGTLTPDLNIPIRNSTFNFTAPQFGGYQPEAGLSLGLAFLSDIQVFMFLEAVQGDRRAHIMQAPKLTVFNGQIATIQGLMFRPTLQNLAPAQLGNGQVVLLPQINQIPFGLAMQIQPVVSPDRRFIRLNVTPQLVAGVQDPAGAQLFVLPGSAAAPFDGGGAQPPFFNNPLNVTINPGSADLQIANTTVNVPDGGTVLLGGFKFLAEERTEYGPPILSKIPYLSRLFRNVGWSRDGSTLVYLVTARIIMVEEEERLFLREIEPIPGR